MNKHDEIETIKCKIYDLNTEIMNRRIAGLDPDGDEPIFDEIDELEKEIETLKSK